MSMLVRSSFASVALKVGGMVVSLLLTIVLARTLGPTGYGEYSYVFALVLLLAIPAQFGLPSLVVRETATALEGNQWARLSGVWRWSLVMAAVLSVASIGMGAAVAWAVAGRFSPSAVQTFAWALPLIPLIAFVNLIGAALRGLRQLMRGLLVEQTLRPAVLLVLLAVGLSTDFTLTPTRAMSLHTLAAAFAVALAGIWFARARPAGVRTALAPVYEGAHWLASTAPLAVFAAAHVIVGRTDTVMLGVFATPADVGVYQVAMSGAALVIVGLGAVNLVVAPQFARLHASGNRAALQRIVTQSARIVALLALPAVIVLVLFGAQLVVWVFGSDYAGAATPLSVLAIGQFVNAFFGSAGVLLNMANHERAAARGLMVAAVLNVVLNVLLIPRFGVTGAAVATTISLVVWNVLLWRSAARLLGVDTLASARIKI